jgi:hypothetical protein
MRIIRVSKDSVSLWRENRKAREIKAAGYLTAITEERNKRFYINQNKGVTL